MKRGAEKPGESQTASPKAENSAMQINGVVSGKRSATCSAVVGRPSMRFSMADVYAAAGLPLVFVASSKKQRVSFAGDSVEVVCDRRAPTMLTVHCTKQRAVSGG